MIRNNTIRAITNKQKESGTPSRHRSSSVDGNSTSGTSTPVHKTTPTTGEVKQVQDNNPPVWHQILKEGRKCTSSLSNDQPAEVLARKRSRSCTSERAMLADFTSDTGERPQTTTMNGAACEEAEPDANRDAWT